MPEYLHYSVEGSAGGKRVDDSKVLAGYARSRPRPGRRSEETPLLVHYWSRRDDTATTRNTLLTTPTHARLSALRLHVKFTPVGHPASPQEHTIEEYFFGTKPIHNSSILCSLQSLKLLYFWDYQLKQFHADARLSSSYSPLYTQLHHKILETLTRSSNSVSYFRPGQTPSLLLFVCNASREPSCWYNPSTIGLRVNNPSTNQFHRSRLRIYYKRHLDIFEQVRFRTQKQFLPLVGFFNSHFTL
ncbi:hypothetical protein V501_02067 [Pseudogymnoascus sp. VKM F-4519 (FW-2642)]|nr:hypothetical protein V501_02067 [Pseudogymnoascus sp. VKM F-4519 (FW-2642)]